jgi:hypothetical protein
MIFDRIVGCRTIEETHDCANSYIRVSLMWLVKVFLCNILPPIIAPILTVEKVCQLLVCCCATRQRSVLLSNVEGAFCWPGIALTGGMVIVGEMGEQFN